MKRIMFAAPLLLLLPAASTLPIQPGKWQTTVTILDVRMPNAPPAIAAAMRGRPQIFTSCVTPAQAAAGPRSVMEASKGKCRYTSFDATGGQLHGVLQCAMGGGQMTVTSNGTYSATGIDVDGRTTTTGRMSMTMRTHTRGRRVGGC